MTDSTGSVDQKYLIIIIIAQLAFQYDYYYIRKESYETESM